MSSECGARLHQELGGLKRRKASVLGVVSSMLGNSYTPGDRSRTICK